MIISIVPSKQKSCWFGQRCFKQAEEGVRRKTLKKKKKLLLLHSLCVFTSLSGHLSSVARVSLSPESSLNFWVVQLSTCFLPSLPINSSSKKLLWSNSFSYNFMSESFLKVRLSHPLINFYTTKIRDGGGDSLDQIWGSVFKSLAPL